MWSRCRLQVYLEGNNNIWRIHLHRFLKNKEEGPPRRRISHNRQVPQQETALQRPKDPGQHQLHLQSFCEAASTRHRPFWLLPTPKGNHLYRSHLQVGLSLLQTIKVKLLTIAKKGLKLRSAIRWRARLQRHSPRVAIRMVLGPALNRLTLTKHKNKVGHVIHDKKIRRTRPR